MATPTRADRPITPTGDVLERPHSRHAWLLLAGILDVVWIFNLLTLLRYPGPSADEADVVEQALQFVRAGQLPGSGRSNQIETLGRLWTDHVVLAPWLQSLAVNWLGLGLYSMRVVSLASGIGLLVAVYAIALRLHGPKTALLAVLLTAFSTGFLTASHLALLDSMVAWFGYGAIALASLNRTSTLRLTTCLAGLAAACAFSVDPSGIIYLPSVLVVIVFVPASSSRRDRTRWLATGFLAGVCGLLIAPLITWLEAGSGPTFTSLAAGTLAGVSPGAWPRAVVGNAAGLVAITNARVPLVVAALAALSLGQSSIGRSPPILSITLFATLFTGYVILHPTGSATGQILVTPYADLLVAYLLVRLPARFAWISRRSAPRARSTSLPRDVGPEWQRRVLAGLAWLLAVASIAWSLAPLRRNAMADFETTAYWVQEQVPPGSVVVADKVLWFALPNQTFVAWQDLEGTTRADPTVTVEEELQSRRPDYVIVGLTTAPFSEDAVSADGSKDTPGSGRDAAIYSLLARYGHQVAEIHAGSLGNVRAYRLSWP